MQDPITELLKPRRIDVDNIDSKHARITIEPLERGYGYTLGNALRRILLSSLPGSARCPIFARAYSRPLTLCSSPSRGSPPRAPL